MKRMRALLAVALLVAGLVGSASPAQAICDESDGCTPCGGPRVIVDGKNTRVEWVVC